MLTGGSALLLVASWLSRPYVESSSTLGQALWGLSGVGAAGLIVVAIGSPFARRLLEARPVLWLGKVSFSLYLVHAPILATLAFSFGDERWWLVGIVGVPLSLLIAAGFFQLVERPSHGLARRVGRGVQTGVAAVRSRMLSRREGRARSASSDERPRATPEPTDG